MNGNNVRLEWTYAIPEINDHGFYVQRRRAGILQFTDVHFLPIDHNNPDYTWMDENVSTGHYHYRLRKTTIDGNSQFSCIVLVSIGVTAAQVVIGASKDNTLIEDSTGSLSNGAGPVFHVGSVGATGQGTIRRGLIAFDVTGNVPAGATILNVILILNMSQTNTGAQTVRLHRALANWGEGTSSTSGGGGAPATIGDATWLYAFFDSIPWTNVGGDFSPTVSASQSVANVGTYIWGSTSEIVSDVQQWLDTPSTNFGWALVGNESVAQTANRFDSKDNPDPSLRPQLQVTYDPPVSVGEQPEIPATFSVSQNYPNPFNPSTTIRFQVPSSRFVVLKVYDLLGQEVATLVNEVKQAGIHEVVWDASEFSSGVYFCRLTTGPYSETRKLVLMR